MKKILKKQNINKVYYICEECKEEYPYQQDAERCELDHQHSKCPHEKIEYQLQHDGRNAEIALICEACGPFYYLNSWNINDLINTNCSEDDLKVIVDVIKKNKMKP